MTAAGAHVALLAGRRSDGEPVHEVVPARGVGDGLWEILGTPALAAGCAAGDTVAVKPDGSYEVRERGGNVAVVVLGHPGRSLTDNVQPLRQAFDGLGASVEPHPDGRWIVVTVPVTAGFAAIEAAMSAWDNDTSAEWHFGNVYDANDQPIDWWTDR